MKRNERKIEALDILDFYRGQDDIESTLKSPYSYSAKKMAKELGISQNSASNLLRRLWRQGLARRKAVKKVKKYTISQRGRERLEYLKKQRRKERIKEKLEF